VVGRKIGLERVNIVRGRKGRERENYMREKMYKKLSTVKSRKGDESTKGINNRKIRCKGAVLT
jgi:hypothetical protein